MGWKAPPLQDTGVATVSQRLEPRVPTPRLRLPHLPKVWPLLWGQSSALHLQKHGVREQRSRAPSFRPHAAAPAISSSAHQGQV